MKSDGATIIAKDRTAKNYTKGGRNAPFVAKMTGFDRLAHSVLTKIFRYRDIAKIENGQESLYLRRFFLPGHFFLHNIRRSDNDRHLHDHPWDFSSLCLIGGYVETWASGDTRQAYHKRWFSPFQIVHNKAEHTHIVKLFHDAFSRIPYQSTWTLVKAGKARRVWGFWVDGVHVDWRTYLGLPPDTPDSPEDI